MEEEEDTARKQQLAMLVQKFDKIKRNLHEDNTNNISQIIGSDSPVKCLSYLMDLEKKGDPLQNRNHLAKLVDSYTQVFSNVPVGKRCQNESYAYARMLVRFAELKAIQDVKEAEASFNAAKSHCQDFAFVHIAHAQFEYSQGHTKKSTDILQKALKLGARPTELLEAAMQNLQSGRGQPLSSEDKENFSALPHKNAHDYGKRFGTEVSRNSDGTGDLQQSTISCPGTDQKNRPSEDQLPVWRSGSQPQRATAMPGRVPIVPRSVPEMEDDDGHEKPVKRNDAFIPSSLSRQTSSSSVFTMSSAKKSAGDGDFLNLKPPTLSREPRPYEELTMVDSTTILLNTKDSSRMEDTTYNFNQILSSNSPEACRAYLLTLERKGDPLTNYSLLTKLNDCYSRVFSRLPLGNHSRSESYARMYIRWAELKGIEDPEDARDCFIIARSNSKAFAFVHIAHAQFEVSQGNMQKAASILQKAQNLNARPAELLENAVRNLKAGKCQLLPPDFSDTPLEPQALDAGSSSVCAAGMERDAPPRVCVSQGPPQGQPKPPGREPSSEWKMPVRVSRLVSPEEKQVTPPESIPRLYSLQTPSLPPPSRFNPHRLVPPEEKQTTPPESLPRLLDYMNTPSLPLPSKFNPPAVSQTTSYKDPAANSYVTPVVKRKPPVVAPPSAPRGTGPAQLPCTPVNQVSCTQRPPQFSLSLSNDSITINGRHLFILKMIGHGGSSKVYQVLDHKKQLFAVKCVNLEEADAATVESYKNEIEHLNRLQQYSDQIIKLYDYEISSSHIYMLMECGNLDLNTWLRNRKTINPLDRKFYWRNMLEAVSTIHKHGIVHSDLKPANFVIVNSSLKLIDFGIANRIQPDVTSIMKDSQVGTLNYMPPEAIKDTSSKPGKASSKISPKGDVWSLGCILYCMTYGKTPFQSISNQITKLHAIIDPSHHIEFPDIPENNLLDVLKRCLVRNPRERISISELLEHPYLQLQHQSSTEPAPTEHSELKRILNDLAALNSPGSIVRAVNNLGKMCNSGRKLDVAECVKPSSQPYWKM